MSSPVREELHAQNRINSRACRTWQNQNLAQSQDRRHRKGEEGQLFGDVDFAASAQGGLTSVMPAALAICQRKGGKEGRRRGREKEEEKEEGREGGREKGRRERRKVGKRREGEILRSQKHASHGDSCEPRSVALPDFSKATNAKFNVLKIQ